MKSGMKYTKLTPIDNVSLIKTRCRASRRGEVFSPVGVRLPNPYENVHLCLEFAIYQTHVIDRVKRNSTYVVQQGEYVNALPGVPIF